jgi:hypothetical protein
LLIKYVKDRKSKFENAQDFSSFKQYLTVNVIKVSSDEKHEKRSGYIHCLSPTYVQENHFDLENPYFNPAFSFSFK